MRNLILLTTAVVLVLVGLHIYLEFDKNRFNEFMENLPPLPSEVPQTLGSTASTVITSVDEAKQMEQAAAAIGMKQASAEAEDASKTLPSTETSDDESDIAGWDTMAGSEENPLSPQIEVLFSKYHALREIRRYVAAELVPMQLEDISIIDEVSEIMADEGIISADGVARANARIRRGKELAPLIYELQDESERLVEESSALLEEYGFSSEKEFYQTHREDYKAWQAAQ